LNLIFACGKIILHAKVPEIFAEVAELADAVDSKSTAVKSVPVRVRPSAPKSIESLLHERLFYVMQVLFHFRRRSNTKLHSKKN
jgi:NTP pyrophosphatase (non-canonical NTP hydrolase)